MESARDPRRQVERKGARTDFGFNNIWSRRLGRQLVFVTNLVSVVLCCADEDQISHMKSVCLDVLVSTLHITVLVFTEDLGDVISVS